MRMLAKANQAAEMAVFFEENAVLALYACALLDQGAEGSNPFAPIMSFYVYVLQSVVIGHEWAAAPATK
jgi:hypothetical protein